WFALLGGEKRENSGDRQPSWLPQNCQRQLQRKRQSASRMTSRGAAIALPGTDHRRSRQSRNRKVGRLEAVHFTTEQSAKPSCAEGVRRLNLAGPELAG